MSRKRSEKRRRRRRRARRAKLILTGIIAAAVLAFIYVSFPLETVVSSGNRHDSAEAVTACVMKMPTLGNTLLAFLWNRSRTVRDYGFIDSLKSEMTDRNTLSVKVTERRMCGYVTEEGKCWYFDGDGRVQASLSSPVSGDHIPSVEGMTVTRTPRVGGILPVNRSKNLRILDSLKSSCDLYRIYPEHIVFEGTDITLRIGHIDAKIGDGSNMDLRMQTLSGILKVMKKDMSGTLHLEDYSRSSTQAVFDKNKKTT